MSDTPTPRTDAFLPEIKSKLRSGLICGEMVPIDFARQLERELAAKERELEEAKNARNRSGVEERRKYLPKLQAQAETIRTLQTVARELAEWIRLNGGRNALTAYNNLPEEVKGTK